VRVQEMASRNPIVRASSGHRVRRVTPLPVNATRLARTRCRVPGRCTRRTLRPRGSIPAPGGAAGRGTPRPDNEWWTTHAPPL